MYFFKLNYYKLANINITIMQDITSLRLHEPRNPQELEQSRFAAVPPHGCGITLLTKPNANTA